MGTLRDKVTSLPTEPNDDMFEDVIPVEDVKEFLRMICGRLIVKQGATDYVLYGNDLVKHIEDKSGFALSEENE